MRIAILGSNFIRIPPNNKLLKAGQSGATEYIINDLTEALVARGHDVTLFASANSKSSAKIVSVTRKSLTEMKELNYSANKMLTHDLELTLISKAYSMARQGKFDIIHSQFDTRSAYFASLIDTPTVSTLHSPLTRDKVEILKHFQNTQYWVSISDAQRKGLPSLNYAATVYHGINFKKIKFNNKAKEYFVFLGRINKDKGADIAVEVAQATNSNLYMMGGISNDDQKFFQDNIQPYITKNAKIRYFGSVPREKASHILKNARALIFPIRWEEPFGLVMIEAMACGTPVIAFDRGSVPEIVEDGVTGYVIKHGDIDKMIKAVKNIDNINRYECRKHVEQNFSIQKMAENYEKVYQKILEKK